LLLGQDREKRWGTVDLTRMATTRHARASVATSTGKTQGMAALRGRTSTARSITMGTTTSKIKKGIKDTADAGKHATEKGKDAAMRAVDKGKAAAARGAAKVKDKTDQAAEKVKEA